MDQATKLRKLMMNAQTDIDCRIVTVISGEDGVGKTSIVANTALQLSKEGKRVIIIDVDYRSGKLDSIINRNRRYDIFDDRVNIHALIDNEDRLGVLSCRIAGYKIDECFYIIQRKIEQMQLEVDVILINMISGMSSLITRFGEISSDIWLITAADKSAVKSSYYLLKLLNEERKNGFFKLIKVISNGVSDYKTGEGLFTKLQSVVERFLDIDISFYGSVVCDIEQQKEYEKRSIIGIVFEQSDFSKSIQLLTKKMEYERINK